MSRISVDIFVIFVLIVIVFMLIEQLWIFLQDFYYLSANSIVHERTQDAICTHKLCTYIHIYIRDAELDKNLVENCLINIKTIEVKEDKNINLTSIRLIFFTRQERLMYAKYMYKYTRFI